MVREMVGIDSVSLNDSDTLALYRLGVEWPTARIAIYGGKTPRAPYE